MGTPLSESIPEVFVDFKFVKCACVILNFHFKSFLKPFCAHLTVVYKLLLHCPVGEHKRNA